MCTTNLVRPLQHLDDVAPIHFSARHFTSRQFTQFALTLSSTSFSISSNCRTNFRTFPLTFHTAFSFRLRQQSNCKWPDLTVKSLCLSSAQLNWTLSSLHRPVVSFHSVRWLLVVVNGANLFAFCISALLCFARIKLLRLSNATNIYSYKRLYSWDTTTVVHMWFRS